MPEGYYIATTQKVDLDVGFTESTALAWNVFAPLAQPGRGDIAGTYVGVDAMDAAVVGVGGNVLLGGSNNSIALQPISVQGDDRSDRCRRGRASRLAAGSIKNQYNRALR